MLSVALGVSSVCLSLSLAHYLSASNLVAYAAHSVLEVDRAWQGNQPPEEHFRDGAINNHLALEDFHLVQWIEARTNLNVREVIHQSHTERLHLGSGQQQRQQASSAELCNKNCGDL